MEAELLMDLSECKKYLDEISPTFCIAKWKQVTTHLESGITHSCHHPAAHTIPLDELEKSVTALHNTEYKKRMRKDMLEGKIVEECGYCNKIEANSESSFSDRIYKGRDEWAFPFLDEVASKPYDDDVFPSYFEVSFSSVCNCRCMYCSPTFSTRWENHIKKHGEYPTTHSKRDFVGFPPPKYANTEYNPYVEAFWKWWPELYDNLMFFRITGGEPILDKNFFKILDYMIEKPREGFHLDINSNLCVSNGLLDKLIEKIKILEDSGILIKLYTSCEAHGEHANYIRMGLDYNKWYDNCNKFLSELSTSKLTVMSTYNVLSISSFKKFLEDILSLKRSYWLRVGVDLPFLTNPTYFQANIISKDFVSYIEDCITFMHQNKDVPEWPPMSGLCFFKHEITKLLRIYYMVQGKQLQLECLLVL